MVQRNNQHTTDETKVFSQVHILSRKKMGASLRCEYFNRK